MICDVCGSVTENVWAYDYYALLSGEKYIRCPECRTPIFADGLRYVLEFRYNHNHDSKGRFCSGSGSGSSAGTGRGIDNSPKSGYNDSNDTAIAITDEAISRVPKMNVFEDDNINRAIQEHSKELLREARKYPTGTEVGAVIELDNVSKISGNGFIKGADGELTVSIPKCPSAGVTIHNHPSGETFSMSDINKFSSDTNAKAMYVIGNNGKCYTLKKNANFNWIEFEFKKIDLGNNPNSADKVLKEPEYYGFSYYKSQN